MTIEQGFTAFFAVLHSFTNAIRGIITPIAKDYFSLVILALSLIGGYYLARKIPTTVQAKFIWVLYGLLIFLLFRFV